MKNEVRMGIQNQANSLEQSLQDKVGAEQLQQLKVSTAQVQAGDLVECLEPYITIRLSRP